MKKLVVVLTKYPEAGKVKTRLGKDIGFEKSAIVQDMFIKNILRNNYFKAVKDYEFKICLKEKQKTNDFAKHFYVKNEDIFSPVGDGLGEIMSDIFKQNIGKYESVILVGSDIPLLNKTDFLGAFEVLKYKDIVLGKAHDGGYYLVGMNKLNTYIFEDIVFSTKKVFDETLCKIKKQNQSVGLIDEKRDIDEISDIIEEEKIDKTGFFKEIIEMINN